FSISAKGTFYVDCDTNSSEDVVQKIAKNNTNSVKVTCTYSIPGEYNIGFGGLANGYEVGHITDYSEDKTSGKDRCSTWGVIQFNTYSDAKKIARVNGSIGKIFPTLPDGTQPTFRGTFSTSQNLTSVPGNLFDGVHGTPGNCMFAYTFASGAIKKIPIGLFSYISGTSEGLLFGTFAYSTGLEEIDIGILNTIKGEQKPFMFYSTFNSASNEFTSIPEDLFGGITGVPSGGLFFDTFRGSKITKLPNRVFSGLYGKPANQSLKNMFALSYDLSGYIPCTFFENLNSSGFSSSGDTSPLDSIFKSSRLLSACPKDMYQKVTGFEGDLDGAVVCCQCPNGGTSSAGAVGVESCSAASVICEAGKYLSSNQTSCSACPSAYPNSPRGARSISQCYATVTYKFNNGSEDISVDIPYSSSSQNSYSVKLPEPSKTDYAFVGWYENSNFSGNVLDNPATLSGNKTLYAQWTQLQCNPGTYLAQNGLSCLSCPTAYPNSIFDSKNIYACFATVTFYPNNNTDNTKENFYYTDANAQGYKIDKTPATNTQYEFIGWFDNSAFSGNPVTKTTVLSG
ncbi:MAG: InlB B-repeat-containing protein, partial [Alphaproteobacteria bacterium]|nr:InlB B-repeat-containing protein [Alphaproteobacteria bacterium]